MSDHMQPDLGLAAGCRTLFATHRPLHVAILDGALDDGSLKFRPMVLPDTYFEAATQYEQYEMAGLNSHHIRGTVLRLANKIKVPMLEETETLH